VLVFGGGLPFFVHRAHLDHLATRYEIPAILDSERSQKTVV
jgi:hypothetical protein